jgi:Phytanoyl-CoA dioxygenase (PhyH)
VRGVTQAVKAIAQRSWWTGVPILLAERAAWRARRWWEALPGVPWAEAALRGVRRDGVVVVPRYLDAGRCALLKSEVDRVIATQGGYVHRRADERVYGAEVVSEPIRSVHDDAHLESLARAYQRAPTVNGFTLAARLAYTDGKRGSGPGWHRDNWFQQFKAIIYLTEVTEDSGPFELILRSHRAAPRAADMRRYGFRFKQGVFSEAEIDALVRHEPDRLFTAMGAAGTLILVDTSTAHRGAPIREAVRYALTNYYYPPRELDYLYRYFSPNLRSACRDLAPWRRRATVPGRSVSGARASAELISSRMRSYLSSFNLVRVVAHQDASMGRDWMKGILLNCRSANSVTKRPAPRSPELSSG